jgi:hypothetical protein
MIRMNYQHFCLVVGDGCTGSPDCGNGIRSITLYAGFWRPPLALGVRSKVRVTPKLDPGASHTRLLARRTRRRHGVAGLLPGEHPSVTGWVATHLYRA